MPMPSSLGPTFGSELAAAGCANGVVWFDANPASITVSSSFDQAYHDKVIAVLNAHDPSKLLPIQVTRKQARITLFRSGLLEAVEKGLTGENKIWYDDSETWTETDPHVVAIGQSLSMTPEQIHQLFLQAQQV